MHMPHFLAGAHIPYTYACHMPHARATWRMPHMHVPHCTCRVPPCVQHAHPNTISLGMLVSDVGRRPVSHCAGVPYISSLLRTLMRARIQLTAFVLLLAILLLAFAAAFHLALGTQLGAWRDMGTSTMYSQPRIDPASHDRNV